MNEEKKKDDKERKETIILTKKKDIGDLVNAWLGNYKDDLPKSTKQKQENFVQGRLGVGAQTNQQNKKSKLEISIERKIKPRNGKSQEISIENSPSESEDEEESKGKSSTAVKRPPPNSIEALQLSGAFNSVKKKKKKKKKSANPISTPSS